MGPGVPAAPAAAAAPAAGPGPAPAPLQRLPLHPQVPARRCPLPGRGIGPARGPRQCFTAPVVHAESHYSQNREIVWCWKGPYRASLPPSCYGQGCLPLDQVVLSNFLALNTSRDGAAALDDLWQYLTTLTRKNFSLRPNLNCSLFSLAPSRPAPLFCHFLWNYKVTLHLFSKPLSAFLSGCVGLSSQWWLLK